MSLVAKDNLCCSFDSEGLEFVVLLKGIDGARRALILHSGGGVQVYWGAMVMVSCSLLLISLF